MCGFDCLCFVPDPRHQLLGLICCNLQTGVCPCTCCLSDITGLCWGCVCCGCQVDPCWLPRQILDCLCCLVPCCGDSCKHAIFNCAGCNPGHNVKHRARRSGGC